MSIRLKHIVITAAISACSVLVASLWLGNALFAARPATIDSIPATLPIEAVTFAGKSGNLLSGWYVKGNAGKGGILLMHSVKSNRREMLDRANFLYRAGYSLLLFDFQAHGESAGEYITYGYLEAQDADDALSYFHQRIPGEPIGVIGASLGGVAVMLSSVVQSADALVLEAVYPSLKEAIANRIAIRLGPLGRHLSPLLIWQIKPRLGFDPAALAPIDKAGDVKVPVLLVAGAKDQHTTLAESERLYEKLPQPKQLWVIDDAAHENLHLHSPAEYEKRILNFFASYL